MRKRERGRERERERESERERETDLSSLTTPIEESPDNNHDKDEAKRNDEDDRGRWAKVPPMLVATYKNIQLKLALY